jgi:hypothetical protein
MIILWQGKVSINNVTSEVQPTYYKQMFGAAVIFNAHNCIHNKRLQLQEKNSRLEFPRNEPPLAASDLRPAVHTFWYPNAISPARTFVRTVRQLGLLTLLPMPAGWAVCETCFAFRNDTLMARRQFSIKRETHFEFVRSLRFKFHHQLQMHVASQRNRYDSSRNFSRRSPLHEPG